MSQLAPLQIKPPTVELLIRSACFGIEILIAGCQEIVSRATIMQTMSGNLVLFTDDQIVPVIDIFLSYSLCKY